MTTLAILEYPDPRLRIRAKPVRAFGAALAAQVDDLIATMYASRGIGLAATQVDMHVQLIVMDASEQRNDPRVFINPQILSRRDFVMVEESCLSVPGVVESVRRSARLRVRALDRSGAEGVRDLDGTMAVCLQHEMDHLQGRLFIDHLSFLRRMRIRRDRAKSGPPPATRAATGVETRV